MTNGEKVGDPQRELVCDRASSTAAPHPEEMKTTVDLRIGRSISVSAPARATPAGLVAIALLVSTVLVPLVWLAKRRRVRIP
jgi:hypothetical protein